MEIKEAIRELLETTDQAGWSQMDWHDLAIWARKRGMEHSGLFASACFALGIGNPSPVEGFPVEIDFRAQPLKEHPRAIITIEESEDVPSDEDFDDESLDQSRLQVSLKFEPEIQMDGPMPPAVQVATKMMDAAMRIDEGTD